MQQVEEQPEERERAERHAVAEIVAVERNAQAQLRRVVGRTHRLIERVEVGEGTSTGGLGLLLTLYLYLLLLLLLLLPPPLLFLLLR